MQLFVDRFGPKSCLKKIFWGTALLCGVTAVCAFLAPGLVWIASDFNTDPSRLMGLLAPTGAGVGIGDHSLVDRRSKNLESPSACSAKSVSRSTSVFADAHGLRGRPGILCSRSH